MGALTYVGPAPVGSTDIVNQKAVQDAVAGGGDVVNKATVDLAVAAASASLATLDAVQTKDKAFATLADYQARDVTNNVPTALVNVAGAPVALQNDGTVPVSRFPQMGSGYLKGPWGFYQSYAQAGVSVTKAAIANFVTDAIPTGMAIRPMCFANVLVRSSNTGGYPVVEIRLGADPSGPLLGLGRGRTMFTGAQSIPVLPVADSGSWLAANGGQVGATVWMYDSVGTATVSVESGNDLTGAMYLFQYPL